MSPNTSRPLPTSAVPTGFSRFIGAFAAAAALTLASVVLPGTAQAQQVNLLLNSSFEAREGYNGGSPSLIPSWTAATSTFGNVNNVSAQFTTGLSGTRALYVNGNVIQTVVGTTFNEGQLYTVSFDIGRPIGAPGLAVNGVNVALRNAGNTASLANLQVLPSVLNGIGTGTFQSFSFSYTATALTAGQPIIVRISDFFEQTATYRIDNVQLLTTPIPEPSTYAALAGIGALGIASLRRRARKA